MENMQYSEYRNTKRYCAGRLTLEPLKVFSPIQTLIRYQIAKFKGHWQIEKLPEVPTRLTGEHFGLIFPEGPSYLPPLPYQNKVLKIRLTLTLARLSDVSCKH